MGFPLARTLIVQKNWDETQAVLKCQEKVDAALTLCMVFKGNALRKRPLAALQDAASKRSRASSYSASPNSTSKKISDSQPSNGDCHSLLEAMAENMAASKSGEEVEQIPVPPVSVALVVSPDVVKKHVHVVDDDEEPHVPMEMAQTA
eukprot:945819-Amphidinium_carterae.1